MFTLYADWRTPDGDISLECQNMLAAHRSYAAYLSEQRDRFPAAAFAYASASWRNDFSDHRAPHDSWVAQIRFLDPSLPPSGSNEPKDLEIVLFGAYHDGHLHLRYSDVRSFRLAVGGSGLGPVQVYRDEVRLSENGLVMHEIEFLGQENWLIECRDLDAVWLPAPQS